MKENELVLSVWHTINHRPRDVFAQSFFSLIYRVVVVDVRHILRVALFLIFCLLYFPHTFPQPTLLLYHTTSPIFSFLLFSSSPNWQKIAFCPSEMRVILPHHMSKKTTVGDIK